MTFTAKPWRFRRFATAAGCLFLVNDNVEIALEMNADGVHVGQDDMEAGHVVTDPVMVSTSGSKLISDDAISVLKAELFGLSELITPNLPEGEALVERPIQTSDDMIAAAIFAGTSDIAQMMLKAGLGVAALLIIVFSKVTTTFLDAWSAGISSVAIVPKLNGKYVALGATALGTAAAMAFNMDNITPFLYLIGSGFAPMIAILIVDFFILKRDYSKQSFDWVNLLIWVAGFIIYRLLMNVDFILGNTLPDMVITMGIAILIGQLRERLGDSSKKATPEREETTALSSEAVS